MTSNVIQWTEHQKIARKSDCQREAVRVVPLKHPVMDDLIRSAGMVPCEWWFHQALKEMQQEYGIPYVREKLLQALEEYK